MRRWPITGVPVKRPVPPHTCPQPVVTSAQQQPRNDGQSNHENKKAA